MSGMMFGRKALIPALVFVVVLVAYLAVSTPASAQIAPAWSSAFDSPVNWQRVTTLGDLVVNTSRGLHGVDPDSGRVMWSHRELGNLPESGYEEIAGAPLVVVDDGRPDPQIIVLNALDGTLVFDSREAGLVQVLGKHVMPRSGGLLIVGFEQGKAETTLFMYDIATGKRLWRSDALHRGMDKWMSVLISVAEVAMDVSPVQSAPIELDDGTFLLGAMGAIHRMNATDGKLLWKTNFAGGRYALHRTDLRPGVVYAGAEEGDEESGVSSVYQAFRLSDGQTVWKKPLRVSGAMNPIMIFTEHGVIVSEATEGKGKIRLLDHASGKSLWGKKGKGIKVKGGIVDHAFTDAGLVLTTGYDSAWTNKGTEYLLYVLDISSGALRFEEPLKVKGRMLLTETVSKGLLYVTTHEVNVFDPSTGRQLHEPVVRSKDPVVTARDGDYLYAFSGGDGSLYRLDQRSNVLVQLSMTPVQLEGKDTPIALEASGDQIVLMGQQNVVGFGADGQIRFQTYHPAPRHRTVVRALMWAQAVRAAMASAEAGVYSAGFAAAGAEADDGSVERQLADEMSQGFAGLSEGYAGLAGDYVAAARKRFHASAASRDFVFMMVQTDGNRYGLAQVSKRTGEIVAMIDMGKDKEPSYQVDDIGNQLFYRREPSVIEAFKFAEPPVEVAVSAP